MIIMLHNYVSFFVLVYFLNTVYNTNTILKRISKVEKTNIKNIEGNDETSNCITVLLIVTKHKPAFFVLTTPKTSFDGEFKAFH